MEHFRAERRELARFVEPDPGDDEGVRHDARIGGQHPVDIGPDLDRLRAERRADERCGVIRAAAPKRRSDSVLRRSDEPSHDRNFSFLHQGLKQFTGSLRDFFRFGLGFHEMIVGDHHRAWIHVLGVEADFAEIGGDEIGRELLPVRGYRVERPRSHMPERGQRFSEMRELVEHRAQFRCNIERFAVRAQKRFAFVKMSVTQRFNSAQRADQMSLRRLFSDCEQCIGRSAKRRHDDDWITIEPALHDLRGTLDRGRVADGSAAELDDDHASPSLPVTARSSAFSTEPPAAPRIVLCPSATMRMSRIGSGRTRPTVTVMPPPVFTSRRGCGRFGSSVTTRGFVGRLGRFSVASFPFHPRRTSSA